MSRSSLQSWQLADHEDSSCRRAQHEMATTLFAILLMLGAVGLLFVGRRIAGAFTAELPTGSLAVTAIVTAVVIVASRFAWRFWVPRDSQLLGLSRTSTNRLMSWGSSAALLLMAVGCSFPFTRPSDCLVWLPLMVFDQFLRQRFDESVGEISQTLRQVETPAIAPRAAAPPGELIQETFRVRDAQGIETIHATLKAEFQAGQRYAVVHVGFCPPLDFLPAIAVESGAGPPAELKVTQSFAHGARIEIKLATAALERSSLTLALTALAPHPPAA